jgi:hypothetical protein
LYEKRKKKKKKKEKEVQRICCADGLMATEMIIRIPPMSDG